MRSLLHLISPALVLCVAHGSIGQSKLPRLERVSIPALDSLGPEKSSATAAISLTGTIAFTGAFDDRNRAVTIMDASGKLLARIGAPGQGPGELSVPMQVAFVGPELVVLELGARRLSRFGLDGSLHGTSPSVTAIFLAGSHGDSLDVFQFPKPGSSPVLDFRRVSPTTLDGRTLLSGQSSVLSDPSEQGRQQGAAVASIIYASAGSTIIAANVATYRLVGVGADGNKVFDIRGARVDVPAGEMQLYPVGGLQVDGKGRIWAIGLDHRTGRTFADLYSGPQSIGRLDLPCRGSVSLAGTWLAIVCATPSSKSRDVALQVYRVQEAR